MKKLCLFCIVFCVSAVAFSQKVYFLYLQTDDQAPFYLRMSDKIYSSAVSGYLILPNLTDSIYSFSIGFAKSTQPETKFAVAINQADKAYLLKNFQEGLSLFDMQDLSIVKPFSANKDNTVYETKSDKFSSILSKAADDPGLLKVPVKKEEEPKAKPEQKEIITVKNEEKKPVDEKPKDSIVAINEEKKAEVIAKGDSSISEPVIKPGEEIKKPDEPLIPYKRSKIKRRSESSTTEGFGIVYFDRMENETDTIRILIPPLKTKIIEETQNNNNQVDSQSISVQPDPSLNNVIRNQDSIMVEKPTAPSTTNSACKDVASEKDFMKLRKNMAAKSNDEDMIAEAKKSFKNKCFTAEQVRYLSTLFLTSAAKYQFFDAAYEHVTDKKEFSSLQSELKDEYYLKRFKALIGE